MNHIERIIEISQSPNGRYPARAGTLGNRFLLSKLPDESGQVATLRFSVEMTKPRDLFGVGESGREAPTFSHPPFSQSPVTSKERSD